MQCAHRCPSRLAWPPRLLTPAPSAVEQRHCAHRGGHAWLQRVRGRAHQGWRRPRCCRTRAHSRCFCYTHLSGVTLQPLPRRRATLRSWRRSGSAIGPASTCSSRLEPTATPQTTCVPAPPPRHSSLDQAFLSLHRKPLSTQAGASALLIATAYRRRKCMELLIDAKADCNASEHVRSRILVLAESSI